MVFFVIYFWLSLLMFPNHNALQCYSVLICLNGIRYRHIWKGIRKDYCQETAKRLGSSRPGRDTWAIAAAFAFGVYEGFQEKQETVGGSS
jgi:hypothetical protein